MTQQDITSHLAEMLDDLGKTMVNGPAVTIATGTGRGPSGRLRNFRAMNDGKLMGVARDLLAEDDDPEAIEAVTDELTARGY